MPTIIATSVNLTEAPRPLPQYENLPSNPGHTNFVTLPDTHGNTSLISCHLSYCGILKNKFRHKMQRNLIPTSMLTRILTIN